MSAVNATQLERGQRFRLPSGRDVIDVHNILRHIGGKVSILDAEGVPVIVLDGDETVFLVNPPLELPDTSGATCRHCGEEKHTHNEAVECLKKEHEG